MFESYPTMMSPLEASSTKTSRHEGFVFILNEIEKDIIIRRYIYVIQALMVFHN